MDVMRIEGGAFCGCVFNVKVAYSISGEGIGDLQLVVREVKQMHNANKFETLMLFWWIIIDSILAERFCCFKHKGKSIAFQFCESLS